MGVIVNTIITNFELAISKIYIKPVMRKKGSLPGSRKPDNEFDNINAEYIRENLDEKSRIHLDSEEQYAVKYATNMCSLYDSPCIGSISSSTLRKMVLLDWVSLFEVISPYIVFFNSISMFSKFVAEKGSPRFIQALYAHTLKNPKTETL